MVNVIASVKTQAGKKADFLKACKANLPNVHAEDGCIYYYPAVDLDTGVPVQDLDEDTVTIIEKWESLDKLKVHLTAPHMNSFREEVKDFVIETRIKVLEEA